MKPRYLTAIVAGILFGTSYIPFPPWAIFFCYATLWYAWLEAKSAREIFWTGALALFVGTVIGFNWVAYTVHEFGHMPWIVAVPVMFLFSAFANIYVPLVGVIWWHFSKRFALNRGAKIAALAVFTGLAERGFPMIFDWHFGYTWFYASFPAYQLADTVGFIGLANIGLFFNAMFLYAYVLYREGNPHAKFWFASVPAAFLVLNLIGAWKERTLKPFDAKFSVLMVQPNIGNQEKLMSEKGWAYRETVLDRFSQLTRKGLEANPLPDYIVWPETAFPDLITDENLSTGYAARLRASIQGFGTNLLTGGYSKTGPRQQTTNSFFALNREGRWLSPPYHKTILLAFGEYLPGAEWYPKLYDLLPQVASFGRGPGPSVLDAGKIKIGVQICYEGLFDWFNRALAVKGAQAIVNVTNDSWYGKWQQPMQHLYMTLARAIEVRRPLVRSTNTGITTVVLANGDILPLGPLHQEWFSLYEVPYTLEPATTPFMGWAYYAMPALLGLAVVAIPVVGRRKD